MGEKAGASILRYWPLLAVLGASLIAWGSVTTQVGTIADGNKAIIAKLDKQAEQLSDMKASLTGLQVTGSVATQAVADLQTRVRAIEIGR